MITFKLSSHTLFAFREVPRSMWYLSPIQNARKKTCLSWLKQARVRCKRQIPKLCPAKRSLMMNAKSLNCALSNSRRIWSHQPSPPCLSQRPSRHHLNRDISKTASLKHSLTLRNLWLKTSLNNNIRKSDRNNNSNKYEILVRNWICSCSILNRIGLGESSDDKGETEEV